MKKMNAAILRLLLVAVCAACASCVTETTVEDPLPAPKPKTVHHGFFKFLNWFQSSGDETTTTVETPFSAGQVQ